MSLLPAPAGVGLGNLAQATVQLGLALARRASRGHSSFGYCIPAEYENLIDRSADRQAA